MKRQNWVGEISKSHRKLYTKKTFKEVDWISMAVESHRCISMGQV